jgi:hypothetical protein
MPKKMKDDKATQTTPVPATPETTTPAAAAQTWDRTPVRSKLVCERR